VEGIKRVLLILLLFLGVKSMKFARF